MKMLTIEIPEFASIPEDRLRRIIEQLVKNNQDVTQGAAEAK